MELIDEFIARYTKEFDFYEQAGRLAAQELETTLQAAGIRSIVTYRAKSIARLRDKCRKRERDNGPYASVQHIFDDIVDLTGVRVALYFPAERVEVDKTIGRLFNVRLKKEFPEVGESRPGRRFTGYNAIHYRVQLREKSLSEPDKRYAAARIEIQVASVLMHAWAEVEHDLVYKPFAGELSDDELAILDQLNGLVIAGEIALETLQKAGETRVARRGRRFSNHYDLAAHLLDRVGARSEEPITEAGLGRVDLLFDLIVRLGILTPGALAQYLEALHENLELRPIAEQIIDALLAEDPNRYETYHEVRAQRLPLNGYTDHSDQEQVYRQVGIFIARWAEIEQLARKVAAERGIKTLGTTPTTLVRKLKLLPDSMLSEYDQYRQMRNLVVHGIEPPVMTNVTRAAERLAFMADEVRRRMSRGEDDLGTSAAGPVKR